ncbi:MAG: UDP-N-acetylmuramate dehydrogenase [Sandaracinaceae bacterium]|nr:UDP-N-acetylmuramate dehydrogenase [Sandaracinaceae bacterium]
MQEPRIEENVPLAPRTTLELGGPARWYLQARREGTLVEGLRWAESRGIRVAILGGGSNLVVPDEGFDGLVIDVQMQGHVLRRTDGDRVLFDVAAGESWDDFVAYAVANGLAGIECLAGIPGRVGATPIQNVGAYGQEVRETIRGVRVLERGTYAITTLDNEECNFDYRDSRFKREPDRFVVLSVLFALAPEGAPAVRYAELEKALAGTAPSLSVVRETILRLRRAKSMVLDPDDENRRSAGSFFMNPIVDTASAERVVGAALREGIVSDASQVPRWDAGPGRVKLAAGWLVEKSGMQRGLRNGHVGLSSKHALALVHHGGGTTAELIAFAERVRASVRSRFGVELEREPVLLGARPTP